MSKKQRGWRFKRLFNRVQEAQGKSTKLDPEVPPQGQTIRTKLIPSPGYKLNKRYLQINKTINKKYGIDQEQEKLDKGEDVFKLKK